jgi:hypothetical protein
MQMFRPIATAAAAALLVGSTFVATPANAQPGGCTQAASGGGNTTTTSRSQRQNSAANLPAVIAAAVQNVTISVDDLTADILSKGSNLSVVCLNDTLNQNDVRVLQNILNESPILSGNENNLNNILRNSNVLSGITVSPDVNVLAVDLDEGIVYLLR